MEPAEISPRAADSDRERVAGQLRDAAAEGRLTPEELDERLDAAYRARTLTELAPLTRDLPPPATVPARSSERQLARARLLHRGGVAAMTSLVCVVIWLATGANGSFWPIWVIAFSAIALARDAWASLGPGAELPEVREHLERHGHHGHRR